ncbi:hypothetical protein A5766_07545 [Gordonia sp. 852002-51296_SCH5728562-b]|nr:hypothetical protein A5766_07545 [Gordonia sp. 852002-51296_SCH5728562-b]
MVERDTLLRPASTQLGGRTARRCSAADDRDRLRVGQAAVHVVQRGVDVVAVREHRLAPESVGDTCRDDERVVGDLFDRTRWCAQSKRSPVGVEIEDLPVADVDGIESTHPLELDTVVARPPVRVGDPQSYLLPADQCGPQRDCDDAASAREVHRGEHTGITHACDHDAPSCAVVRMWRC